MTTTLPAQRRGGHGLAPLTDTPYLELDVRQAVGRFSELAGAFPGTAVHYAVKANPHPDLLAALAAAGCRFDVASPTEVRAALRAGARAETLLYSHPVKRRDHVLEAAALGVRLFVVDSESEVAKIADAAPGSAVLCRLVTSGEGSDWPLSRKYGCATFEAVQVLGVAADLGLDAAGVCFHVGSQQREPEAWSTPIGAAAEVFDVLRRRGVRPWLLDLGGGFPAVYDEGCRPVSSYGAAIEHELTEAFGNHRPRTIIEPGRGVVGDAGTIVSTVVAVVHRAGVRWVYLDVGVFTGLVETLDESIRYRVRTSADGGPCGPCVLAGPTCDSTDVLYEDRPVELPLDLAEGDEVRLLSAGAYTTTCSSVGFNGFAPLATRTTGG